MTAPSWRSLYLHPIRGPDDAAAFVGRLGFCTWGPVPGLNFPNLAEAMGESAWSVLDRTWFWKDDLHLERRLYYGKIIRGQPTFIAPDYLPARCRRRPTRIEVLAVAAGAGLWLRW